jgi:hypothetical protein
VKKEVSETLGAFLLLVYGLAIGILVGSSHPIDVSKFAGIAEAAANVATAIGILIGGAWAYKRYVERNEGDAHAELSHHVEVMAISSTRVLRVTLAIKNAGQVEFCPTSGDISVQLPPPSFKSEDEPCDAWQNHLKIDLPFVANSFSLETGAVERYCRDFTVPSHAEWIQIHSNVHAGSSQWDETSLHRLT